jgi:hypothetical protein
MGNPNPSPATRFSATNPGRAKQKGARDRLSAAFLEAFASDFDEHGKTVIQTVRETDPGTYMRVAAGLLPKQVEVENMTPESGLTDDEVEQMYESLKAKFATGSA